VVGTDIVVVGIDIVVMGKVCLGLVVVGTDIVVMGLDLVVVGRVFLDFEMLITIKIIEIITKIPTPAIIRVFFILL
jgi:hypothetical protein